MGQHSFQASKWEQSGSVLMVADCMKSQARPGALSPWLLTTGWRKESGDRLQAVRVGQKFRGERGSQTISRGEERQPDESSALVRGVHFTVGGNVHGPGCVLSWPASQAAAERENQRGSSVKTVGTKACCKGTGCFWMQQNERCRGLACGARIPRGVGQGGGTAPPFGELDTSV